MMLSSPTRDFLVKAEMYAKENRFSEFNNLETELIILEETLIKIKESIPPTTFESYNQKINTLQEIIRAKKKELL